MEVIKEGYNIRNEKEKIKQNLKQSNTIQIFVFVTCSVFILLLANLYFGGLRTNTRITHKEVWTILVIGLLVIDLLFFSYFLCQNICYRKIDKKLNKSEEISPKLRIWSLLFNAKGLSYEKILECKIKRIKIIIKKFISVIAPDFTLILTVIGTDAFDIFRQGITTYEDVSVLVWLLLLLSSQIFSIPSSIFALIIYFYYGEDKKSLKIISILTFSYLIYQQIILLNQERFK